MSPSESADLIDKAGGVTAFGKLLRIDTKPGWQQRVFNWKARGIPSDVVLDHYEVIQRLRSTKRSKRRVVS